ncbi:MAG: symporter small accessory protein [Eubacteriaceae bacterium]
MFGLGDFWVTSAFVLSLLSVIACVVYGIMNWNKGSDDETNQIDETIKWQAEDGKIEENF